ncbi:MAG TPA: cbb3-type cytochrome c oxidase N-terminal domain-containing protein [Ferruginibacter sp.]|nr:cbb3-type cytochrome c oxidase N-terminal domain-containing protein [Ferruginibacter sp.]
MNFSRSIKNKTVVTLLASLAAMGVAAQDKAAAATQPVTTSGYNQLATLLVIMIVVLAFVIWGMGHVLTALGRQLLEKGKASSKALPVIMLLGLSLLSQATIAQDATANAASTLPNYGGLSENTFYIFVTVLAMEVLVILFLGFSIRRMYTELLPEKTKTAAERSKLGAWWAGLDKKIFTKAVPVEREADVMLDHDYDGIKELDNALPPWWKYGFYFTIVVGLIYLVNFHVMGLGKNPTEEYNAEMEAARIQKERYEASNKDKIDENKVPMADAAGIKEGQQLFEANCAACHLKDGGGNVGPNLTDDYWLHKGSLNDIYRTIKVGYPDKGMQSWSGQFSPKQISYLASFIKSIHGTKPATPKAQQGEFWVENPAGAVADSVAAKPDSGVVAKPDSAGIKK